MSNFAVVGGSGDPIQCAGGRGMLTRGHCACSGGLLLSRAAGDQAAGAATRDTLALARIIAAPRSEEHQMSVFIVSRSADRSRPVATQRCTTKGAGPAWTPGPAGPALPAPPPLCRPPR